LIGKFLPWFTKSWNVLRGGGGGKQRLIISRQTAYFGSLAGGVFGGYELVSESSIPDANLSSEEIPKNPKIAAAHEDLWKVAGASRSSPLSGRLRPDPAKIRRDASRTVWSEDAPATFSATRFHKPSCAAV
jgi:hypothetical protein